MRRVILLATLAGVAAGACRDGEPGFGQIEGMSTELLTEAEKDAVLEVVNTASVEELDVDAALDKRAAENIVLHRDGPDALLGTADDDPFDSLGELDAVPHVGPATITRLVAYAQSLGLIEEGEEDLTPTQVAAILGVANTASLEALDVDVGLDKRAAENIVLHRIGPDGLAGTGDDDPFETLAELDGVPYVGESALAKLLTYAETLPPAPAPCLIISEYLESNQNVDAIELFNCGQEPIEQSEVGVCLVRNDDTTCTITNKLSPGVLLPGEVWEICRSTDSVSWLPSIKIAENCRQVMAGVMNYSGDDRLLVFHDVDADGAFGLETDAPLDAFGVIAARPPSDWWKNMNLRRCNLEPFDGFAGSEAGDFSRWDYFVQHGAGMTEDYGLPPVGDGCP